MLRKKQKNDLYCQFLIAAQKNFTVTELAERLANTPAHDSFTKWLETDHLTPALLWKGMRATVDVSSGDLIIDDTVFDKWHSSKIKLVYRQYSGTHHRVVDGIGLVSLLWFSHFKHLPVDFKIYDPKTDGRDKNDHFQEMLKVAKLRGFNPGYVIFDAWYASLKNLKAVAKLNWFFVANIAENRQVSFFKHKLQPVSDIPIPQEGTIVHLKGFGMVRVFKIVRSKNRIDYLVSNNITICLSDILDVAARRWEVELYHRGLKQTTGVALCQARTNRSQRNHIFCSIRVFLSLEKQVFKTGYSFYELKKQVIKEAISLYLRGPTIELLKI